MSSREKAVPTFPRWTAIASLLLAAIASAVVLFLPMGTTVEARFEGSQFAPEHRIERLTLPESSGRVAYAIAAVPVVLAALGALAAPERTARGWRVASAVLLVLFCGATVVTVGIFYTPAALAMIVAALAG